VDRVLDVVNPHLVRPPAPKLDMELQTDGFEFGMTLFVCAFTAPLALIAGLVADGAGGIPGWFAPTLAAEERAEAARERRRGEARQIRAAAQGQPDEVREALLLAARSLEEEQ
jgi:hypothetical protein